MSLPRQRKGVLYGCMKVWLNSKLVCPKTLIGASIERDIQLRDYWTSRDVNRQQSFLLVPHIFGIDETPDFDITTINTSSIGECTV